MGFFSDLKEDLSQAVNELLPDAAEENESVSGAEETVNKAKEETMDLDEVNLSDMLDKLDQMGTEFDLEKLAESQQEAESAYEEPMDILKAAESILEEETTQAEEVLTVDEEIAGDTETTATEEAKDERERMFEETDLETLMKQAEETLAAEEQAAKDEIESRLNEETIPEIKAEPTKEDKKNMMEEDQKQVKRVATDEVAVITEGMTIRGDIETEGSLDLLGKVIGNIDLLGKLNITGTVEGNSSAAEVYAEGAHVIGELKSDGALKIGQSSVIIGNIYGFSAVVAGAIKGDIDVKGPVILDSTAIVMGNIKSKSVQINNGAVIEGMCSQCYADISPTTFFSELKNM